MAEGFLRKLAGDRFDVQSAGTERRGVNPLAIRAMAERGIDISNHTSKLMVGLMADPWDYVITVCDDANETCPIFPRQVNRLHWSFPDPSKAMGSEEEQMETFRAVRDAIESRLRVWLHE